MSQNNDTNEQKIALAEIKVALDALYSACQHTHAALCGYVFSADPPFFVRFGNVRETGPDFTALLLKLDDFMNETNGDIK